MRMRVLQQFFGHLPQVGSQRARRLREEGFLCWDDLLRVTRPGAGFSPIAWDAICRACERSQCALSSGDAFYFVRRLPPAEQWRVLAHWFDQSSYFDIETDGLDVGSSVTLICCFHQGEPLRFLMGENIDDFLDLLDQVKLLVSFNGSSFDVPRVLDRFHIPALPCAHLDLRWLCHPVGWRGGLKRIEMGLGIQRPSDLVGMGGAEAVDLWRAWSLWGDGRAKRTLERYCMADTVMLSLLAARLLAVHGVGVEALEETQLWRRVEDACPAEAASPDQSDKPASRSGDPFSEESREPLVCVERTMVAGLVGELGGLTRAEKQARLRARWRLQRGGGGLGHNNLYPTR